MKILTLVVGLLMVAVLAAGHVEKRSVTDRLPVAGSLVPVPVSVTAGVEVLLLVR